MTDKELSTLLQRASHATAGPAPGIRQIQARQRKRRQYALPGLLATTASALAAFVIVATMTTSDVQTPVSTQEPDMLVITDPLERSDWLVHRASWPSTTPSRSDWLLAGSIQTHGGFSSDALSARSSDAYLLVDKNGDLLTDPDYPNIVYIIERTTP